MTSAALLLLVSGSRALAEDEPAARAPLPPPLRGAPAEAGERQMRRPSAESQSVGSSRRRRSGSIDQSPNCRKRSLASTPRRISVPRWPRSEKRLRGLGTIRWHADSRRQGHRAVASEKRQRRDRSPAEPGIGQLSPRATIPIRRSRAPPSPRRSRDKLHPSIIPITLPVRPHMVMPRAIPMHGHHPDLGSFGKGGPSPECRTPL